MLKKSYTFFFSGVNKKVPFKTFFSAQFQFVKEKEYL